ncbi:MAG: SLATT domain-containing protein [Brevundimonas sp.]
MTIDAWAWVKRQIGLGESAEPSAVPPAPKKTPTQQLLWDLGITARARFSAARRLQARENAYTRLIAMSSAYLIVLTVFSSFIPIPDTHVARLNLATVALSIIVLVSSLLQNAGGGAIKSDQHQRSAMEIDNLRRKLEAFGADSDKELREYHATYNEIIHKYAINHTMTDFRTVQIDRRFEFPWFKIHDAFVHSALIWWDRHIPNFFLLAVTVGVGWLVFGYGLPAALE